MLVGYARVSTVEQVAGLESQERDLRATGCNRIITDRVSSVAQQDQLAAALDFVRDSDTSLTDPGAARSSLESVGFVYLVCMIPCFF